PRQERRLAPRPADLEFESPRELTRVQALFREWPSLVNQAAVEGYPICKRASVKIKKLPEEILVQLDGRAGIAPECELDSGIQADRCTKQVEYGIYSAVDTRVISVATLHNDGAPLLRCDGATGWGSDCRPDRALRDRNAA